MEQAFDVTAWTSPLGIGLFLVCIGLFIFLLSKSDQTKKK